MPKQSSARNDQNVPARRGIRKPRIAANGHRLPDPIPRGEILTDVLKRKWKLGKSIGIGGFGEIYLASDDIKKQPGPEAKYVIKVEPHSNGPLFAEMHFYHRVAKPEQIYDPHLQSTQSDSKMVKSWVQKKKLKFLGMPKFIGSGSHVYRGVKYRFMIMERFGEDLQKLLERNNRMFPLKTVYTLGVKILHILEYIHSHGYIHADVKASNLTSGFGKGKEDQVHLIDYGLACRYAPRGVHKEFKEDLRKAHDGTIEYTSRDAHIGAHSRRGDLEILGYNMLQWLSGRLPWEDNLKDPEYVSVQKNKYMSNIPSLMKECFPSGPPPQGIQEYLMYVANLRFDEEPDYEHCSNILKSAIKASGYKDDGKLVYMSEKSSYPGACRKRHLPRRSESPPRKVKKTELVVRKMPSENSGMPQVSPCKETRRVTSATTPLQSSKSKESQLSDYISTFDNPTPAMLLVMQRKMEQLQQQAELRRVKNGTAVQSVKNDSPKNGTLKDKSLRPKLSPVNNNHPSSHIITVHKRKQPQKTVAKATTLKARKATVCLKTKLRSQMKKSSTQRL